MSEFDFYDDFKSALDNERKFDLHDADWQDMTARLERMAANRRRRWAAAIGGVMTVLLLLTSLGWWKTYRALTSIQAQNEQKSAGKTQSITDTVRRQITIVQVDTIYKTVHKQQLVTTINEGVLPQQAAPAHFSNVQVGGSNKPDAANLWIEKNKPAVEKNRSNGSDIAGQKTNTDFSLPETQTTATRFENGQTQGVETSTEGIFAQENEKTTQSTPVLSAQEMTETALLLTRILPVTLEKSSAPSVQTIAKSANAPWTPPVIRRSQSHTYALGLTAGPMFQPGSMLAGRSIGLKMQKSFGRRLRLTAEGRYVGVHSRFDAEDRGHFHLPDEPPPPVGFDLKHLEVMQQKGELALGLRWQMRTDKRLQPYLEAGVFGGMAFDGNLKYKFEGTGSGAEMVVEKEFSPVSFGGQFAFGADWRLGKFALGAEALWMPAFEEHFSHNGGRIGLRLQGSYFF
ncbi:MAG: outer membrane beta-barrel protein [Bacteroidota bacterium]